jgi:hypothetical protein
MLKYSKYSSVQGGPFTTPNNRMIDLEVPEGIQFNPAQSFIQFILHLDNTSDVVRNYNIFNQNNLSIPFNLDLIRNAYMVGSKVGRLEDIRRCNVLNHNLLELTKGTIEKMATIDSIYQAKDYNNGFMLSPFVNFRKDGNVASEYIDAHIRIPLSHLFSLGSIQMLDTNKTGKINIHLELDSLSYLVVQNVHLLKKYNEENILDEGAFLSLTAPGAVITTATQYEGLQNSPYYVGEKLNVTYRPFTTTQQPVQDFDATIINISYSSSTGLITITLDTPFPAFGAGVTQYQSIVVDEFILVETPTLQVMTCELGVAQYGVAQPSPDVLTYTTFTTEEFSAGNNSIYLNKVFEIEPNAINAMLFFNGNNANMLSNNTNLASYRMRIDNQDVYDRDILTNYKTGKVALDRLTNDSLHFDSINRTFLNASLPLRNLTFMAMIHDIVGYDNELRFTDDPEIGNANKIMLLATPTPLTTQTKKLQFNLQNKAGSNIGDVILYKQVLRTVNM